MPKKVLKGKVVSDKMDKTISVAVINRPPHERYKKFVTKTRKFKAHDEKNECKVGDLVEIIEHRPLSKTKKWILSRIVEKGD
ncbi:MAG: 30S ribosomal protein S17 [Candidatus Melainabacteria bacterium]|nr:30S ribosomal protein S17 [Candidatus Melainabacteria bacterium]MBI3309325.1 30S ribosomal protein S17 [Candidatus Melainabacteria bacterium]